MIPCFGKTNFFDEVAAVCLIQAHGIEDSREHPPISSPALGGFKFIFS